MSPSQSFTHKLKSLRVTILLSSFHDSMSKTKSTSTTGVLAATQKLSPYSFDTWFPHNVVPWTGSPPLKMKYEKVK